MAAQPRNNIKHARFDDGRSKAIDEDSKMKGKSVSENIHDIVCEHLDGRDQFEALRAELIEQVIAATEQSTALMIEAVTASVTASVSEAVLGKLDQGIKTALADMGKPERDARARLQLNTEKLFNTIQADIDKIGLQFKAINDTLVSMQQSRTTQA